MDIPIRLKAAGFAVAYKRISYESGNPLWRANAHRDGRTWSSLGRDLEAALNELETQTQQSPVDWREAISLEKQKLTDVESLVGGLTAGRDAQKPPLHKQVLVRSEAREEVLRGMTIPADTVHMTLQS